MRIKSNNIDKKLKEFISAYGNKTIFNENFEVFFNKVCKILDFIEVIEDGELRKQQVYIYFGDEHTILTPD
ncbi:MAG: hypothetical protein IPG79_16735 [Saprospiraceae bacterium]|nr:hypothetical protein [Saprospiraceae bacterium]